MSEQIQENKNKEFKHQYKNKHELLLPVGNFDMALAAIHNGADAIYVGVPGFNARGRTVDFELDELQRIIETAHLYGVKVNLALNILIFENELETVANLLQRIIPLRPDSFIVQDLGIALLIRKMAPEQVIHASTQMTITNYEAINLLEDLNIKRFVLGRENSIREIELIKKNTYKEIEVFVHGALCVAYSGQCLTSESIGGRSANRGQCAQSCRFSYEMYVDGKGKTSIDQQFLVSPQDLCGLAEIPKLMDLGVESFKVEGRLKSPEYVASVAQEYRNVIDKHFYDERLSVQQIEHAKLNMASVYSRGFFSGWLHGVDHQRLVDGRFSSHRGAHIGKIDSIDRSTMLVSISSDVKINPGDGLLWARNGKSHKDESGGQVYTVEKHGDYLKLGFARDVNIHPKYEGADLYLNSKNDLKNKLSKSFHDKNEFKKITVKYKLKLEINSPIQAQISDGKNVFFAQSEDVLQQAKTKAIDDQFIIDELMSLGGTVFSSEAKDIEIVRTGDDSDKLFISHKILKELRRALTAGLGKIRRTQTVDGFDAQTIEIESIKNWLYEDINSYDPIAACTTKTKMNVLLREIVQVEEFCFALADHRLSKDMIDSVILDFEFGLDFEPSLKLLRSHGIKAGIATTRILKPQEYNNLKTILRLNPDVILVRNLGALRYFTEVSKFSGELIGDFSLNITNHLSFNYLMNKGLSSICTSYDLNKNQLQNLLDHVDRSKVEITAHQYMPSFHMEHCVFAAFLSKGSSFKDCGKPCEKHKVELKDQFGNMHLIKPDQECRNTMYNAISQSAARFVPGWINQGVGKIRYEALFEKGEELINKIKAYQEILLGQIEPQQAITSLNLIEKYGLDEGLNHRENEYVSRKKTIR